MTSLIHEQKNKMSKGIKAITFDLDDTFWDVKPVLINAELQTRKFIEDRVGKLEWGSWEDFKPVSYTHLTCRRM